LNSLIPHQSSGPPREAIFLDNALLNRTKTRKLEERKKYEKIRRRETK
jgi:hypothetical protein